MATAHEAIVALNSQFRLGGRQVQVKIVDHETVAALHSPIQVTELHVMPSFTGGGGVLKIIIGVVLIVVAVVVSLYGGAFIGAQLAALGAGMIGGIGASLVLGGIQELLSPAPKTSNANQNSNLGTYLGAPKNTVAIGTRIIQGYGRFQVYGQVLSYNVIAAPSPIANSATQTRTTSGFGGI